jgi:uncharacterized RDD family membrane protein YckC
MSESNSSVIVPPAPAPTYALWADRVLALLLDGLLAFLVCIVMYVLMFLVLMVIGGFGAAVSRGGQPNPAFGVLSCGGCLMFLILPPLSWFAVGIYNKVIRVGKRGASIGQEKLKLRVIGMDGSPVPTSRLFLRLLVQSGFCLIFIVALLDILWPLWDPHRQTLHDKAVGTYVIKVQ